MADINLHFTGDMHAITSANNLLCSVIDNHIYKVGYFNSTKGKELYAELKKCLER